MRIRTSIKPVVDVFLATLGDAADLHAGGARGRTARGRHSWSNVAPIAN